MATSRFKEHFEYTDFNAFYRDTQAKKGFIHPPSNLACLDEAQQQNEEEDIDYIRRPSLSNTLDTLSTASLPYSRSEDSTCHTRKLHNSNRNKDVDASSTLLAWCLRQKAKINRFRHLL